MRNPATAMPGVAAAPWGVEPTKTFSFCRIFRHDGRGREQRNGRKRLIRLEKQRRRSGNGFKLTRWQKSAIESRCRLCQPPTNSLKRPGKHLATCRNGRCSNRRRTIPPNARPPAKEPRRTCSRLPAFRATRSVRRASRSAIVRTEPSAVIYSIGGDRIDSGGVVQKVPVYEIVFPLPAREVNK